MRLKFEISSAYLSQCLATLHCFLSKSLKNSSKNFTQFGSWTYVYLIVSHVLIVILLITQKIREWASRVRKLRKIEKIEAFYS